jgi:hypothetical protein
MITEFHLLNCIKQPKALMQDSRSMRMNLRVFIEALCNTIVAIKLFHPQSLQGEAEFHRQVIEITPLEYHVFYLQGEQ